MEAVPQPILIARLCASRARRQRERLAQMRLGAT
jgi:hypothetical protein